MSTLKWKWWKKFLSTPSDWEKKTIVIEEVNDLSTFTLDNLIENLMAYEVQLQYKKKYEQLQSKKNVLAFNAFLDTEDLDNEE